MEKNFDDPQSFLASSVFSYLAPPGSSNGTDLEKWSRWKAICKRYPNHFIVRERVPGFKDRYLSIGQDSDYSAEVLAAARHADSIVVATLVKERLVTWAAIDWLADLLTKVLGRKVYPEQIRHCGLKDRWAQTAQTIVLFGVTVEELKRVNWPYTPGKTGFFLKDIRWHDGRRRVHPAADEKRNRVFTEVAATVTKTDNGLARDALLQRVRQQLSQALGREIATRDVTLKGQTLLCVSRVSAAEMATVNWSGSKLGFTVRDVRLNKSNALSKGDHRQNRFELKIVVKGKSRSEVSSYLDPLMERLEQLSYCVPNAVGFQRLAARQLGHLHGYTLVTGDYKAPKGVHAFGSNSEAALYRFLHETSGRENPAAEQLRHEMEPHWLYDFGGMKQKLGRSYRALNMSVEYKIVERLADNDRYRGDFQEVVRSMNEETSMWVAAWQSWWWNHVLVRKLPHWVREAEEASAMRKQVATLECSCNAGVKDEGSKLRSQCACEDKRCSTCQKRARLAQCQKCRLESRLRGFNPLDKGIPLLMDSPQAREYYGRLAYCKDGIEQLDKSDGFVREQFLKPRGNTPWRKAFIRVEGLKHSVGSEEIEGVEETIAYLNFELPSGAYATTFLGLLFELEEPAKRTNGAIAEAEGALDDEAE